MPGRLRQIRMHQLWFPSPNLGTNFQQLKGTLIFQYQWRWIKLSSQSRSTQSWLSTKPWRARAGIPFLGFPSKLQDGSTEQTKTPDCQAEKQGRDSQVSVWENRKATSWQNFECYPVCHAWLRAPDVPRHMPDSSRPCCQGELNKFHT